MVSKTEKMTIRRSKTFHADWKKGRNLYVCMHACMHMYVCMHACMHACMYACMHARQCINIT